MWRRPCAVVRYWPRSAVAAARTMETLSIKGGGDGVCINSSDSHEFLSDREGKAVRFFPNAADNSPSPAVSSAAI